MTDPNITEEVFFEMLEKKADGSFKVKYPKIKSKSGITFDAHVDETLKHRKIVAGYYTGDGQSSKTINIGFTPSAVFTLLEGRDFRSGFGALATADFPATLSSGILMEVVANGFKVYQSGSTHNLNYNNYKYNYIAIG